MTRLLLSLLKSGVLAVLFIVPAAAQPRDARVRGSVADPSGAAIGDARIELFTTSGTPAGASHSRADGSFEVSGLGGGSYALEVNARLFATRRIQVDVAAGSTRVVDVRLGIAEYHSHVSVTAERGRVADVTKTAPLVTARDADVFSQQALPTIGHALTGAAGVMLQQSTHGQVSPFLRGLTGYQVLNLVDGVRFNNTTFRSGPNQYLAFTDPSQAERIEALLGPSSSQFGSDALGGTIQVLTPAPRFIDAGTLAASALVNVSSASADGSRASDARLLIKTRRAYASVGGSWRAHADLRAGGGVDSHHVFKRLFGLSNEQLRTLVGSQQTGTGFSQSAAHAKVAIRLRPDQTMTVLYQASEQRGVTGYKDVWGGLGRVRSEFSPQRLQFAYGRYETLAAPGLDSLTATVSINAQTDGSVRQNLRFTDAVTADRVAVAAFGYAGQATTHFTTRDAVVFGGELYDEHVDAMRDVTNPLTGLTNQQRALYPNGSVYRTAGFFLQDVFAVGNIEAVAGVRYTRVTAQTFADRNRTRAGTSLGVADSRQPFSDWTYNLGLTWQATPIVAVHVLHGRGFRAPNLNDLGAVGLNDLGYEIPAADARAAGALVGASDGEGVPSTGRPVANLRAERLMNYEVGITARWRPLYLRLHGFDAELEDPVVRRTLLFPLASLPASLTDLPVTIIAPSTAQSAQAVASVATAVDPRAVKSFVNDGRARYRGADVVVSLNVARRWTVDGHYSVLRGHDLDPIRPVRRLPPAQGAVAIRHHRDGIWSWVEASATMSAAQSALSGGDLTDERIGAARRRSDISDFFQGGLVAPYIGAGADGVRGTADDVFTPTNETLAQIRDRVLPIGATINGILVNGDGARVPLYLSTPSFVSIDLGTGFRFSRRLRADFRLTNLLDRNYRIHGSGVDSAGVSVFGRLRLVF